MAKDYYETLGISKEASSEEIKKAYKKLARKYHPDISKEENAEDKFKEVQEAYDVLSDEQKKSNYDKFGSADGMGAGFGGGQGGFSGFGGGGFEDIFEQFGFGSGFGGGGFSSRGRQEVDNNVYKEIEISLDDVYFGVKKDIKIKRDKPCSHCDGKGAKNPSDVETCQTCGGTGTVIGVQQTILGTIRTQKACPDCRGQGETIKNPCSDCHGTGTESSTDTIEIKIPKGIESGTTLRMSGKGSYNKDSKSTGDLFVKVYIQRNKEFEVDGSDLYKTMEINFIQAILGDEIEFDHFDKTLSLKIPSGTQPNTTLRLKDKGLPVLNSSINGDLFIKLKVDIPKKTSKEQRKILIDYAKTLQDKSIFERVKSFFK